MKTYPIKHKEHGQALVDANTDLAALAKAGWDVAEAKKAIAAEKAEKTAE